jgi:hypothetical protein
MRWVAAHQRRELPVDAAGSLTEGGKHVTWELSDREWKMLESAPLGLAASAFLPASSAQCVTQVGRALAFKSLATHPDVTDVPHRLVVS